MKTRSEAPGGPWTLTAVSYGHQDPCGRCGCALAWHRRHPDSCAECGRSAFASGATGACGRPGCGCRDQIDVREEVLDVLDSYIEGDTPVAKSSYATRQSMELSAFVSPDDRADLGSVSSQRAPSRAPSSAP